MPPELLVRTAADNDLPEILDLNRRVFGPGRFVRTAYRVREGTPAISRFCLVARLGQELVAAIRFTPVVIGGRRGALLLGPLAVEPRHAGLGYGRKLVAEGIAQARQAGIAAVILVGDEPYYARFGFRRLEAGQVIMPGPVDPDRLLIAELAEGAGERFAGTVVADVG